jgi:hypothetical protein
LKEGSVSNLLRWIDIDEVQRRHETARVTIDADSSRFYCDSIEVPVLIVVATGAMQCQCLKLGLDCRRSFGKPGRYMHLFDSAALDQCIFLVCTHPSVMCLLLPLVVLPFHEEQPRSCLISILPVVLAVFSTIALHFAAHRNILCIIYIPTRRLTFMNSCCFLSLTLLRVIDYES